MRAIAISSSEVLPRTAADLREACDARPDSVALEIVRHQLFVQEIASQHSRDVRPRTDQ